MPFTDLIGNVLSEYGNIELGMVTPPDGLEYLNLKPSFDAQHVVNQVVASSIDGSTVVGAVSNDQNETPNSQTKYGVRSKTINPQSNSASDIQQMSDYIIATERNPKYRFDSMALQPVDDANLWTQVLGREISDRITVKRHPASVTTTPNGNLIRKDQFVEAVSGHIEGLAEEWTFTFELSPAGNPDDYPNDHSEPTWFIIGDPVYGLLGEGNCFVY